MKKLTAIMAGVLALPLLTFGATAFITESASAQSLNVTSGVEAAKGDSVPEDVTEEDGLVKKVINILLWAIGIISVIMIIIGGIRYATSNGDSTQVTAAKNTIMYAVVGLVIAIFAYAIVNFVLTQITGGV